VRLYSLFKRNIITSLYLAIPLIVEDFLVLDEYKGQGLQEGEQELPDESKQGKLKLFSYTTPLLTQPSYPAAEPEVDQAALAQLEGMGFPTIRCKKALLATGGDPEVATGWLFEHMDDPDIDAPNDMATSSAAVPAADPGLVSMLQDMGFTASQASKALRETVSYSCPSLGLFYLPNHVSSRSTFCVHLFVFVQDGNMERAVEWLFSHPDDAGDLDDNSGAAAATTSADPKQPKNYGGSPNLPARYRLKAFISHKGPSVHSGHYVAHIRHESPDSGGEEEWVLFNDEKVVKADAESVNNLRQLAYLYVFERV
jgi:ubiquitin carboxyl-terminal hydrolase 5/13